MLEHFLDGGLIIKDRHQIIVSANMSFNTEVYVWPLAISRVHLKTVLHHLALLTFTDVNELISHIKLLEDVVHLLCFGAVAMGEDGDLAVLELALHVPVDYFFGHGLGAGLL